MPKAYIFFAEGFEESEALVPSDFLHRAGIEVVHVGVDNALPNIAQSAHHLKIAIDCTISDIDISDADALVLPGGLPGADNLARNSMLSTHIRTQLAAQKIVAAICASPARVLGAQGFLAGKKFTCYPSQESFAKDAIYVENEPVVQDENIITSKGVGSAMQFAYVLICNLVNETKAKEVWDACLVNQFMPYPSPI